MVLSGQTQFFEQPLAGGTNLVSNKGFGGLIYHVTSGFRLPDSLLKIEVERRRYAWIWSHQAIDSLRLMLWKWMP